MLHYNTKKVSTFGEKMTNLLIKNANIIATMDHDRKEIFNKSINCEDGKIIDIGDLKNFNYNPELIIDAH